ncbi:MAG TPA: ATP-binding protein, partial [Acidimicrobiales bacterium]|nr:ATP-binding protein [Acidimicrobiales bacterium]
MWEREAVTDTVAHTLAQARAGHGGALFVLAEAGLGKTSVLDVARAQAGGEMDVGFGRGEEMEATLPFGVAIQAFRTLGAKELVDVLRAAGSSVAEPAAPFHRTMRWFEQRGGRPALLVFDDLHWADADSLAVVAFLVRRLASLPVAVVGALRPWPPEADDVVRGLVELAGARLERLAP